MRRGNENKTKQIKIANVRRNLVPIVVQVQGDKQVARALESWLAPCLEEDRIDRKCLGRERSTMNESRCRWNAVHWQTCVRETDEGREGLGGRRGERGGWRGRKGRSQCGLLSSHGLHTFTSSLSPLARPHHVVATRFPHRV